MSQPIPKFSTTLNDHLVFIPAMVWGLPEQTLSEAIETLRDIDEYAFVDRGLCSVASFVLEPYTELPRDVHDWVGRAVCYFDHTKKQAEEAWLGQYFYYRFGLRGLHNDGVHYSHEQLAALRLAWLRHIINHLEEAAVK